MLTVKEMIELNNEKRKLLTPDNKEYYENMLAYIRLSFLKDEKATEEVLLEMLDHLIEAQKEGKSAQEVFGKTPKELADELAKLLPKDSFKNIIEFALEILLSVLGWTFVILGIATYFIWKTVEINMFVVLVPFVLISLSLFGLLILMRKNFFEDSKKSKRRNAFLSFLYVVVSSILIAILMKWIEPYGPDFKFSYYTILGLGCFFLLASYLFRKIRESK